MKIAKCICCDKILREEDTVYTVRRGRMYGQEHIAVACSIACAKEATAKKIASLEEEIAYIRDYVLKELQLREL